MSFSLLSSGQLLVDIIDGRGWITLNREHALNSLSFPMMQDLHALFQEWNVNDSIKSVVICGNSPRAFCSGGDLKMVHAAQENQDFEFLSKLFETEYSANLLLKQFSKPYMALMHGYTMGGGMGASVHGTYRVITDNSILAMPETSIGYFPDVGGSYFLNQCPGSIGLYLGLTGLHISGFDAVYAGWATHYVPSDLMDKMKLDLRAGKSFDDCLRNYSKNVPFSTLQHQRDEIDAHFNHDSLEDIFHSLENSSSHFAKAALSLLNHRSPISLHVSFRQLKISRNMNFANIMASEYKLSQKFVRESDFKEGIRAAIVTKDRAPKWKYASIYDVPPEEIDEYFLSSNKALSLDS